MHLRTVGTTQAKSLAPKKRDIYSGSHRPLGMWSWAWAILLIWLVVVFYLVNFRWPILLSGELNLYFAQPLMWTSVTILAYLGWRFGLAVRPPINKYLVGMAILTGLSQIALSIIAGLFFGFGHSPYSHRILVLLGNILYVGSMLIAVEISRAYLVAVFSQRSPTIGLLVASFTFWLLSIPAAKMSSIHDMQGLLAVSGKIFLPAGAENLLASFLALIGGPIASIAYRGTLLVFEWLYPILPNPHWTITAFIGTITPIIGMLIIRSQFLIPPTNEELSKTRDGHSSTMWILIAVLAVTLLWINTGMFGFQPTLVSGVSMEPVLSAGDLVITRHISAEELVVGDIIHYREGNTSILHRVVEIQGGSGELAFITKGDANNVLDSPVPASALQGKVILVIPKIGWVSIWIRRAIAWVL